MRYCRLSRRRRTVLLPLVAILALLATAGLAQQSPVTGELVKMLEAELSEELILEWLAASETPVGTLSADDLVALKQAGASENLMRLLLERARGSSGDEEVRESEPAAVGMAAAPKASPAPVAAPAAVSSGPSAAPTSVVLSYLARVEEPDPEWDLYVYIDGFPVSYITADGLATTPTRLEFARAVPAGRHVIRVTQERHVKRRGGWQHATRVASEAFEFDLAAELPAKIELEFHERMLDYQDPLVFKLTQGESVVDSGRVGGEAEFWPLLCEDVEASVAAGKKPSRQQQRQLEDCVSWESLWGEQKVPSRQEVLEAMAQFDYRPVPKGS